MHLSDNPGPCAPGDPQSGETRGPANNLLIEFGLKIGPGRYVLSLVCFGLAILLFWEAFSDSEWPTEFDDSPGASAVGLIFFLIAVIAPCYQNGYIDLRTYMIVNQKGFGPFRLSNTHRPLAEIKAVVVRHVCESESNEFTASIGLKPKDGGTVQWIKDFRADQEEVPQEAINFAEELGAKIELPVLLSGRPLSCE